MKMNKKIIGILAVMLGLAAGTTVWAKEFQPENGVVTIEMSEDGWEEQKDSNALMTLTDGESRIVLQHFSNGEKLPEITAADDTYPMVYQNIISTREEVFLVTGCAGSKEDFEVVKKAVQGAVINRYDTKKAVHEATGSPNGNTSSDSPGEKAGSGNSIKNANFTGWVTTNSVNVREQPSLSAEVIGYVFLQDPVEVTGIAESGDSGEWYRIRYGSGTGYVSADYISETPSTAETMGVEMTDEMVTVYKTDGNGAAYIYKSTDGYWYDGSGRRYAQEEGGTWELLSNGSIWTEELQDGLDIPEEDTEAEGYVSDSEEGSQTSYLQVDGE